MKTFKPKKYVEGKITSKNCKHELLSTSGFDDGMYGTTYNCMICGHHLHYSPYERPDLSKKFVFTHCGCLTQQQANLIHVLLKYIAQRYIHEETIDIAGIFKTIYPFIEGIARPLQEITETDRKIVQEKYRQLFRET